MKCEIERMEINYTFYFFAFFEKVIKKLLTFCYWQNCKIDFDFLTCFSCQMLWILQWECTAHHRWDKIAPDWCGFCLPLSHVLPKNGYKKTAVKCSVFTTVCFVFNSILGVTTQGSLWKFNHTDDRKVWGISPVSWHRQCLLLLIS